MAVFWLQPKDRNVSYMGGTDGWEEVGLRRSLNDLIFYGR